MKDQLEEVRELLNELQITQRLLKYDEAAEVLNIKPTTLRKWVCEGRVPHVKIGSAVRFKRREIEEFIERFSRKARNGTKETK